MPVIIGVYELSNSNNYYYYTKICYLQCYLQTKCLFIMLDLKTSSGQAFRNPTKGKHRMKPAGSDPSLSVSVAQCSSVYSHVQLSHLHTVPLAEIVPPTTAGGLQ